MSFPEIFELLPKFMRKSRHFWIHLMFHQNQNQGSNSWDIADIEFLWVGGMQSHFPQRKNFFFPKEKGLIPQNINFPPLGKGISFFPSASEEFPLPLCQSVCGGVGGGRRTSVTVQQRLKLKKVIVFTALLYLLVLSSRARVCHYVSAKCTWQVQESDFL